MTLRMVQITISPDHERTLQRAIERLEVFHSWHVSTGDNLTVYHCVTDAREVQRIVDVAQSLIEHAKETRVTVLPVELALPRQDPSALSSAYFDRGRGASVTREELRSKLAIGARLTTDYLLMVILSTIVAVIGLVGDNVAVVVGAMVIAPFLGPNLALAFATTMGDRKMLIEALKSLGAGLGIAVAGAAGLALFWPNLPDTSEIAARTVFGIDALILAIASGGAAVLALTGAAPMTLVGVMVAVALLPPATVLGLKLGAGDWVNAEGAALLLMINIIGLNLSAKAILTWKGISPRRWAEKSGAVRSRWATVALWLLALIIVAVLAYRHQRLPGL